MAIDNEHNILKGYNMLIYFAGSMIIYEPSEECIVDFWKNGILKNLPVSSSNPSFIKAASQLRQSCTDKSVCCQYLREDYIRLFAMKNYPIALPYQSLYMNNKEAATNFKLNGVTEFYDSYGWVHEFKNKIKDDHLGIELLFLTVLIDKYLDLDDEACKTEMKKEIRRFINHHILSWVGTWNEVIQQHSNTLSFKGIGTLILACGEDIFSLMDHVPTTSFSEGSLKN